MRWRTLPPPAAKLNPRSPPWPTLENQAVPALIETLRKDKEAEVRSAVAAALGAIGSDARSAVPTLISALEDKETEVRVNAIDALSEIGPEAKTAGNALKKLQDDKDKLCRTRRRRHSIKSWGEGGREVDGHL